MSDGPLPSRLEAMIDEVVARAGLRGPAARHVRGDLEQHVRDGLAAGRSEDELVARFGDPEAVAPLLAGTPGPPAPHRTSGRGDGLVRGLVADLRFGLRVLARNPTLSLTAAVVLALGIGANTVVFTVVNELLLRPLPVREPETLVDVWPDIPGGNSFLGFAWEDFRTYRESTDFLDDLALFAGLRVTLGDEADGQELIGLLVSPEYFPMLGLAPSFGRLAFPPDAAFGGEATAVLSHAFWQEAFGADPGVVGRTVRLDGRPVTVQGVGPDGFNGHFIGFPVDVWLPVTAADPFLTGFDPADRARKPFEMIGRLRRGATPAAAQAALNEVAARIESTHPDVNRGHRVGVTPTTGLDHSLESGVTAFAAILTVVSALVLLIACLNVGSVLLVRAMSRDREMAIRLAIGAGNGRLVRQLLTESSLLVAAGAGLGVAVAMRLTALLGDLLAAASGGLGLELAVDWRVLGFTAATALAAAALASAAPALHIMRKDPAGVLRSRGGGAGAGTRLRTVLVVGQVAVSVVLVTATGLFVRALVEGARADPGFDADRVAAFALALDPEAFDPAEARVRQRAIVDEVGTLRGVEAVTVADAPVLGVARTPLGIDVPGVLPPPGQERVTVDVRRVGAGYLGTVGIPLRAGRDVTEADAREGPPVAVVSEAFAERYWPGDDALGRTFVAGSDPVRVVGVAADARYLVQDDTPDPLLYLSLAGRSLPRADVTVRTADGAAVARDVQAVVAREAPGHRPVELRTARRTLRDALFPQRMGATVVGAMGLAALLLAAVGLYGLVQFTVTRDTHELGVRLALGGSHRDLLAVVLRKGFLLVAAGTTLGIGLAAAAAPALGAFLAGVSPRDPLTYGLVVGVFGAVALLASWLPARRAARIHPSEVLRDS